MGAVAEGLSRHNHEKILVDDGIGSRWFHPRLARPRRSNGAAACSHGNSMVCRHWVRIGKHLCQESAKELVARVLLGGHFVPCGHDLFGICSCGRTSDTIRNCGFDRCDSRLDCRDYTSEVFALVKNGEEKPGTDGDPGGPPFQTQFQYDSGNRLTKITYPDSSTVQFAYDSRGRRTSFTDQNGKVTAGGPPFHPKVNINPGWPILALFARVGLSRMRTA